MAWKASAAVRDAAWLGPERAMAWARVLAVLSALTGSALIWATRGGALPDWWGRPLGTDFVSFWSASRLAWMGTPQAAWDPAAHWAMQQARFGVSAGFESAYYAFFYPPPFLLACLPFGLLPYGIALAAWLLTTTAAFVLVVRALLPPTWPATLVALAFPAVTLNAEHGQNGALSAALMGAAALHLDRRPGLAGACLGLLVFKPQLALLVVPALLAARRWRALGFAATSAGTSCLLSWLAFGGAAWRAFAANAHLATETLQAGLVGYAKMTSAFAALRLLGVSTAAAWAAQFALSLAALALTVSVARRRPGGTVEIATVAAASCLATPFLLDYDLMLLAIPLAVIAAAADRSGFRPYEKVTLAATYTLPLLARPLATQAGLPVALWVVAALLAILVRRHAPDAAYAASLLRSNRLRSLGSRNRLRRRTAEGVISTSSSSSI